MDNMQDQVSKQGGGGGGVTPGPGVNALGVHVTHSKPVTPVTALRGEMATAGSLFLNFGQGQSGVNNLASKIAAGNTGLQATATNNNNNNKNIDLKSINYNNNENTQGALANNNNFDNVSQTSKFAPSVNSAFKPVKKTSPPNDKQNEKGLDNINYTVEKEKQGGGGLGSLAGLPDRDKLALRVFSQSGCFQNRLGLPMRCKTPRQAPTLLLTTPQNQQIVLQHKSRPTEAKKTEGDKKDETACEEPVVAKQHSKARSVTKVDRMKMKMRGQLEEEQEHGAEQPNNSNENSQNSNDLSKEHRVVAIPSDNEATPKKLINILPAK